MTPEQPSRFLWTVRWIKPQVAAAVAGGTAVGAGALWNDSRGVALGLGAVAAVAAMLSTRWTIRRIRRLRRLERGTRNLAQIGHDDAPSQDVLEGLRGITREEHEFAVLEFRLMELAAQLSEQVKDAAKKSRNMEALIDALDEPVLATDNDDRVLLCNRSAEAMLGVEPGKLIGRLFSDLFTQEEVLQMHLAARRGETRRGRIKLVTPLGTRTMQLSSAPVPVAWGEGIFGAVMVLRDVTELAQAVQVKTDFVANASHELRTPVAAIRGAAETLSEAVHEDAKMADRLVTMILGHTQRLEEMLRDLLDLSRLESPETPARCETVDLQGVARSLRAQFDQDCAARKLTLNFEFDDDLVGLRTDPTLLNLALRNLVENALKFAYEGTTVHVRGSLVEEFLGAPSKNALGAKRGIARFEVEDKGIGIPLQHQDRVFERYYQVDPSRTGVGNTRRGTGLGLAIVKHAAKSLRGRVGLSSVWREGTKVWIEWPVEIAPDDAGQSGAASPR